MTTVTLLHWLGYLLIIIGVALGVLLLFHVIELAGTEVGAGFACIGAGIVLLTLPKGPLSG